MFFNFKAFELIGIPTLIFRTVAIRFAILPVGRSRILADSLALPSFFLAFSLKINKTILAFAPRGAQWILRGLFDTNHRIVDLRTIYNALSFFLSFLKTKGAFAFGAIRFAREKAPMILFWPNSSLSTVASLRTLMSILWASYCFEYIFTIKHTFTRICTDLLVLVFTSTVGSFLAIIASPGNRIPVGIIIMAEFRRGFEWGFKFLQNNILATKISSCYKAYSFLCLVKKGLIYIIGKIYAPNLERCLFLFHNFHQTSHIVIFL